MSRLNKFFVSLILAVTFALAPLAHAAKSYQVTGTVIKLTEKIITVQKANDEKWEIDRDEKTRVTGELKVGAKVTIEYTMTAGKVEVKK